MGRSVQAQDIRSSFGFQRELLLQLSLAPTLMAVKGEAAPDVERAFARARALCERMDDPAEVFPALVGLWTVYTLRAKLQTAHELAEELMRRAQNTLDPAQLLYAHYALGNISFFKGEFPLAREQLEMAIALYDGARHRPLTLRYAGIDAGVWTLSYTACTLWLLGYPDQALERINRARTLAQELAHHSSLVFAELWTGVIRQLRRELRATQETAHVVIALSTVHGLTDLLAIATILSGWAFAAEERHQESVARIRESLAALRATGTEVGRPFFMCLLAEACRATGRFDEGLSTLTEALVPVDEHEVHFGESEIHRLKGELLLKQNNSNAAEAQSCFERAIEIARSQSARSWELRATISLARLFDNLGRRDEARTILADIYNWFTEGFDTADLKDAKALLEELGGTSE